MQENDRMARVETQLETMTVEVRRVADGLNSLIRLEERQIEDRKALGRAFEKLEKIEGRIGNLETANALVNKDVNSTAKWMDSAIFGILGVVGAFVAKKVGLW